MEKRHLRIVLLICALLPVMVLEASPPGERIPLPEHLAPEAIWPGVVMVKLSSEMAENCRFLRDNRGAWKTGQPSLDAVLTKMRVHRVDTLFAPLMAYALANEDGRSVNKLRSSGLLRWFRLSFNPEVPVLSACKVFAALNGVRSACPAGKIVTHGIPSDPLFSGQWFMQNTGQSGGLAGADIRAVPAWEIQTGIKEVKVAVHDGGIQLDHPDLKQQMLTGASFNFVSNTSILAPDQHSTHVAGLLAATRNNRAGVSGVAGGDGSDHSGIRMMSLQIVGGNPVIPGHEALSFIYAAQQGASISQNSWSYSAPLFFPDYMADAIDFFVENGGGTVLKGGLVIFSAGNSNSETPLYPGAYSRVLAVAATNHKDRKSAYSNYGDWVDISAPGGEADVPMNSTILNGNYGSLFGTSMACPLVSGVAALLLSHLPGRLSADELKSLVLYGNDDITQRNEFVFLKKLGVGRLNALKSLLRADSILKAPLTPVVQDFSVEIVCNRLQLKWTTPPGAAGVLVAMEPVASGIGSPFGQSYKAGDTIPTGGRIIYAGNAGGLEWPLPVDGSSWEFRIWAAHPNGYSYSEGNSRRVEVPFTVTGVSAVALADEIRLTWQRQCPNRGVLLAWNENGKFGTPSGNPASITQISGGGNVLQFGNQQAFNHTRLPEDATFHYAFFPYFQDGDKWVYANPYLFVANTTCSAYELPVSEGFTGTEFPPKGWKLTDGGPDGSMVPDGKTWRREAIAGSTPGDRFSIVMNAYTQNGGNSRETLRVPSFVIPRLADSVIFSTDYAYRAYASDPSLADSLEIAWTDDCGSTYHTIWRKGGENLATIPGFSTAEFIPETPESWKKLRFRLDQILPAGRNVSVAIIGTNKFGQNLWIDQVEVRAFFPEVTDVAIKGLVPGSDTVWCSTPAPPILRLTNSGKSVINSFILRAMSNSVLIDSLKLEGWNWAPGGDTTVALKKWQLSPGMQQVKFETSRPNGSNDDVPSNDTLRVWYAVAGSRATPFSEDFNALTGLPQGWLVLPAENSWTYTANVMRPGNGSMFIPGFTEPVSRPPARLLSPVCTPITSGDSVYLRFSYAAALRQTGGNLLSDTFEISITNDCGKTGVVVFRKSGAELATANVTLQPFLPESADQWRSVSLNITGLKDRLSQPFQLNFSRLSGGGNHIYLDDITLDIKNLPALLKAEGYGVFPNPFNGQFKIWHLRPVPEWRSARLVNSTGQVVGSWNWQGNAPQTLDVQTANLPTGVYWIHLQYEGLTRTLKLLKW